MEKLARITRARSTKLSTFDIGACRMLNCIIYLRRITPSGFGGMLYLSETCEYGEDSVRSSFKLDDLFLFA